MKNKIYTFDCCNGKVYAVTSQCCLICKNCTNIICDYDGPYMMDCRYSDEETSLPDKTEDGTTCDKFELQEGILTLEEYKEKNRREKEQC